MDLVGVDNDEGTTGGSRDRALNANAFVTPGTIVIKKVTDPASDTTTDFNFTATGNVTPTTFTLKNGDTLTYVNVAPGTYTVTEAALPGWALTNLVCVDPSGNSTVDLGAGTATLQVASGETVTCTFTNVQRGKIIVKKVTNPASDTTTDFGFTPSAALSPLAFNLKNGEAKTFADVVPNVPSGATYSVTESTIPAGWTLASATCDNGSSVSDIKVNPGQTVTCTFTNTQGASIVIKKVTDPASDSTTIFGFTASGGLSPGASISRTRRRKSSRA
jgi:plastocyanin